MIFVLFFLTLPFAQESDKKKIPQRAFLESGPLVCTGMPEIGMNAIKGYKGVYLMPGNSRGEEKAVSVTAYFTKTSVPVFSGWVALKAGTSTVYRTSSGKVLIYRHNENWTLFLEFRNTAEPDLVFAESLIAQMVFFARDGTDFENTSFPAVVEIQ